jgi:hypothetical protein
MELGFGAPIAEVCDSSAIASEANRLTIVRDVAIDFVNIKSSLEWLYL